MINIIHQIAFSDKDLDGYVPPNKENLEMFLPNAKHYLWDLPRFTKLLQDDGATDVLNAINNIKPYAYKSDIARYYLIYKTGGWYTDQNNYFQTSPSDAGLHNNELVVFAESQFSSFTPWGVQNSLFYANPEHRVIENAISQCIQNVKDKHYGIFSSCPTGPNVLGAAVASQRLERDHTQVFGQWYYWGSTVRPRGFYLPRFDRLGANPFPANNKALALWKPYAKLEHPGGESGVPGGNNYFDMWTKGQVY